MKAIYTQPKAKEGGSVKKTKSQKERRKDVVLFG